MKPYFFLIYLLIAGLVFPLSGCSEKNADNLQNTAVKVEAEQVKHVEGSELLTYSGTIEESETIGLLKNLK